MSSNITNTTTITTPTATSFPWAAVIFLIFVCILLIIAIISILYFEKVCCFARYRFLKHFLRRLTQNKKSKTTTTTKPKPENLIENKEKTSSSIEEYLWIAGQREHIKTFEPTSSISTDEFAGTDLPDDDYTTIVPPIKQTNNSHRKLPIVPTIIENKENESPSTSAKKSKANSNDRRKTTITGISRRRSTIDYDAIKYTQSAPSSPNLSSNNRQRATINQVHTDQIDVDGKSVSSDRVSILTNGPNPSLSSGALEIRLKFDAKNSKMWVFVIKANLEMNQRLTKQTLVQIHLTMLPNKRIRFRTRAKPADNAMFAEEFFCKVSPESIQTQGIRFRLYTNERFKREKLLAEATVMFGLVNLDEDMCKIIPLERAYPSDDSDLGGSRSRTSSNALSRQNSTALSSGGVGGGTLSSLLPELEVGLAYDKNQSILILEVGKGINFGMTSQGRAPDTYVQITLLNSAGEEMVSNRTVTRRAQHHPVFAERYPFNIQENLLDQITLVITVINKKPITRNDSNIGWISFGHGASGNAQVAHWDSMLNAQGETVTRWHALLES